MQGIRIVEENILFKLSPQGGGYFPVEAIRRTVIDTVGRWISAASFFGPWR